MRANPADLLPNGYNPNELSDKQFQSVVGELRRNGTNTKPILVRNVDGRTVIIDGEQTARAAVAARLESVEIEFHDCDDWEARRLTYRANLNGNHNPLKLGRMIREMLALKDQTHRELARELGCSEGTVRNRLLYADLAEKARDDKTLPTEGEIATMPIRKVRELLGLDANNEGEGDEGEPEPEDGKDEAGVALDKAKKSFEGLSAAQKAAFLEWAQGL